MTIKGFPFSPEEFLEHHSSMVATWVERSGVQLTAPHQQALTEIEQRNVGTYLKDWYPWIYLWGPRGDRLRENYERILVKLNATQKTTWKSFMPNMLMFYNDLPVNEMRARGPKLEVDREALKAFGDFCGIMGDHEIWSPVIGATDHPGFGFDALVPDAFPTHLFWQVHFHHAYHDAVKKAFNRTKNQTGLERGMRWFEMFVLGGEYIGDHPGLAPSYAAHVKFCKEHDLLP